MATSLLRGLQILELLGEEPRGVSELARALGVDKAGVSRTLAALHSSGWVIRTGARYALGERALGIAVPSGQDVHQRAVTVCERLVERTGLSACVLRLAGSVAQPVAMRSAEPAPWLDPPEPFEDLWSTAGGLALLAQLPDERVDALLRDGCWPAVTDQRPDDDRPDEHPPADALWQRASDAASVRAQLSSIRLGGVAEEHGWTVPGLACLAMPWALAGAAVPHAGLVLGPRDSLAADPVGLRHTLRKVLLDV